MPATGWDGAAAETRAQSSSRTALQRSPNENGCRPHQHGYEVVLSNGSFHPLAIADPDPACQMNLDLLTGARERSQVGAAHTAVATRSWSKPQT